MSPLRTHTRGEDLWHHTFLTSALDRRELSTPSPGRFTPGNNPGTHYVGGWVVPRTGLDV